jgi:uncharacterized protein (DUF1697 family)
MLTFVGLTAPPPPRRAARILLCIETKVALLRGINLGKRRVTNARLTALFELAGCVGVSTFQAAGNVLFEDGPSVAVIRSTIEEGLGYDVAVYLRTATEMAHIATAPPFADVRLEKPASLLVSFFDGEVPKAEEAASNAGVVLRADGRELYWLAGNGVAKSTLDWRLVEQQFADPGTNRNINTVRTLASKLAG